MNSTSGFQARRLLPPYHHLASCTSTGVNPEQVPGSFSALTISSLSPQAWTEEEKRFQSWLMILAQHRYPDRTWNNTDT
jgi:hypothetical protein